MVERRDAPAFSLEDLLAGGAGLRTESRWIAFAPHLDAELEVELEDLAVLEALPAGAALPRVELDGRFGEARVSALLMAGLLLSDEDPAHAEWRARDQSLRDVAWWAPSAVVQAFGRWQGVDVSEGEKRNGKRRLSGLVEQFGLPPPAAPEWRPKASWLPLPVPAASSLDELLARRSTCRNFSDEAVPLSDVARVLHRVFAAQGAEENVPGARMLKKNSPSGGGLHPIEAFVLARRVEGLESGLYHYASEAHALAPLAALDSAQVDELAHELVAGQDWFARAPVLVLMAARFQRTFWKYRAHAKAWKVVQLDAGHLSQNLYITATELGYGAFITAAINDRAAERAFEFDGLSVGAIAVCGFGKRAAQGDNVEFDPLGKAVR
jgi:putative peptide maturation dehydrogenase